ncbi:polyadenylate-binding protein 1-like [Myxocyprinus asiaticus]|uniref:polyadenylate-binding protein 1-like n=1 Tax=Myxocyprinus asiaticus TaxID=70543 RepID=UPI002223EC99|nr:polyadenylate-binding protein 1-like [Myxocyprinus asiaticus]
MSSINIDERSSLFVGDLHPDVTEEMLLNTFIPFGPIFSVRVCRDRETLLSLGYGYVNFVNLADAENALDTLLFQVLIDRPMRIMFSQRDATLRKTGIGNIFIKGLAKSINSLALYDTFSTFGDILSCKVVCDKNGSKVYGYVHFATYEAAEMAIRKLNGMMLNDQIVSICHYKLYEERQAERMASFETRNQDHQRQYPGVCLYVSNLPYNMHNEQLRTAFSPFGTVISAKMMMENGWSKGFGFVAFISAESATKAVATMNGRVVGGRLLSVVLSLHNQEKSRPGNNEHENESPPPALRPIPPDVPSGQFVATVPQVPDSVSVCPVNQLVRLQPNSRRAAVGVLPQGESLRPLISAALLDVLNSELPHLLISVPFNCNVSAQGTSFLYMATEISNSRKYFFIAGRLAHKVFGEHIHIRSELLHILDRSKSLRLKKTSPPTDPAAIFQLSNGLSAQADVLGVHQQQLQQLTALTEEMVKTFTYP